MICIFLLLLVSLFPLFKLVATNMLVQELTNGIQDFRRIILLIVVFCLSILLVNSTTFINLLGSYLWITAEMALQSAIIRKSIKKTLVFFDMEDYYKKLEKAKEGYSWAVGVTMMFISTLFIAVTSFLSMTWYLSKVNSTIVLILVFVIPLKLVSSWIVTTKMQYTRDILAEDKLKLRKISEYTYCVDSRIFKATDYFLEKRRRLQRSILCREYRSVNKNQLISFGTNTIIYLSYGVVMFISILSVDNRLSSAVILFVAMESIFNSINAIAAQFGDIMKNSSLSKDLYDFLSDNNKEEMKKKIVEGDVIKLRKVSFKYPGSDKKVIDSIDLDIKHGENIAIVGKNGAGKTTLVKLLSGLYQPTSGSIRYGRKFNILSKGSDNITIMPQDIMVYNSTLGENIGISYIEKIDDDRQITKILKEVFGERKYSDFVAGSKTRIGKEFGGVNLSRGEQQRISYGRTLYRPHTVVFFDEPTSALDPLAEEKIYREFLKISKEKTTIFVTHRLASVRFADRILVMEKGRIVEQGTHDELICKKGLYSRIYNLQKSSF